MFIKTNYSLIRFAVFAAISMVLNNKVYSQSVQCTRPSFTSSKEISIRSMEIREAGFPLLYANNSNSGKEIFTNAYLSYSSDRTSYITYSIKVTANKGGSIGMFVHYNSDNIPDEFKLLNSSDRIVYSTSLTLPDYLIKVSKIRIDFLNTGSTTMDGSSYCNRVYSDGELESYVFNLFDRKKSTDTTVATANISGGGVLGSDITITVNSNGVAPPWEVLVGPDYNLVTSPTEYVGNFPVGINQNQYFYIEKTPFSFPSNRVGTYRIRAVNGNTEGNGIAVVYIEDRDSSEVFVWNAVSPNNDGKNDFFEIEIPKRLESRNAKIIIYDREGTTLTDLDIKIGENLKLNAASNMYVYQWNCKNQKGDLMNPGTYYYSFKVVGLEKDKKASKSGFIEIRR